MGKKRAADRTREVTPLSDADVAKLEESRQMRSAEAKKGAEEARKSPLGVSRKKIAKCAKHADAKEDMASATAKSGEAPDGVKSPRGPGGKKLLYAIRGGQKAGVYSRWYQAADAGFKSKQGFGNGVTFDESEADLAHQWAFDKTNLQPEGKAAILQQSIKEKHILFRVLFVTIIFSVVFQLTHLGVDAIGWWNDCTDKTNRKLAVCIGNAELNLFLLKYEVEITTFCYAQFIAMMTGLFVWLVGCVA
ncbi:hypothetical protein CYMTET_53466 [Cymbomonas tetramitiformis]|uniref:Uncharacterized protein n=1 Tax=Cymbomonas tetramitiformis TaxID=36881 RepID=A0AAE0EQJ9_9CHLO|nr:hypothetical protein CYMTET_53466 [Cymbomonas tetramitiformis]